MASNIPDLNCCEICGLDDLSEDEFRNHTHTAHVEGCGVCPFCELTIINPAELILHVNQAHLDFLTPDSEHNMSFIDDPSPSELSGFNGESSVNWNNPGTYSSNKDNFSYKSEYKSSYSNINLTPKVNGGGEISPQNSSHGQGSPLRCNLALKLKSPAPALQCPMCNYTSDSPSELEEHVNRSHFDLISPSVANCTSTESFPCPLCIKSFISAADLELHVNIEHKDILSPASSVVYSCPVCGLALDRDTDMSECIRTAVYSIKEKLLLTQLVKENSTVENKKTDGATVAEKNRAWDNITNSYNSQPEVSTSRTQQQLRKLWNNLKQRKRKETTELRHDMLATGGGPMKIMKPDPVLKYMFLKLLWVRMSPSTARGIVPTYLRERDR